MPNFYNLLRARKFSTAADTALEISPSSSATPNFSIDAGGKIKWGSGSATPDTTLYRSASNVLKTDDSFDLASGHTYKIDGADVLTATALGSSVVNSSLTSVGTLSSLTVSGRTDVAEIREAVSSVSISSGTLTCNYNDACVFYIASMSGVSGNFTVNVTNAPTDNNYAITISIIVNQGSTGYYPSVLQIAGSGQSIRWVNDTAPSVNANKIDIYNFTLIRISGSWVVLGSASNNYDTI
jgi:3D (Asp-Asp-Asp) domain-containing protein